MLYGKRNGLIDLSIGLPCKTAAGAVEKLFVEAIINLLIEKIHFYRSHRALLVTEAITSQA